MRCSANLAGLVGLLAIVLLQACSSLQPPGDRSPGQAFASPESTTLGAMSMGASAEHPGHSGFLVLDTGRQAFLARAALIEAAERSIDAQYYIWNGDVSGRYLACRLYAAADRGVRVRLVLDDMNVGGRDAVIAALDEHPNIEIRIFNPSPKRAGFAKWLALATEFQRLNRRMHNKTFVVDAAFGIIGGRNIGDEYFDLHLEANFRDRDVLAAGPIVHHVSQNFDAYWNTPLAYPIGELSPGAGKGTDLQSIAPGACALPDHVVAASAPPHDHEDGRRYATHAVADLSWAEAELVYDAPASGQETTSDEPRQAAKALAVLVEEAEREILVESAYLVLGDEQLGTLAAVTGRGVRVAALTNSLASNDLTANHSGYARRRSGMISAGMKLYELRPDAASCATWMDTREDCGSAIVGLHAKSAVFDRKILFVGSFNVNLRSIYLNSETVLLIHSQKLAEQVAQAIETGMLPANSWQVSVTSGGDVQWSDQDGQQWTHEPATGFWRRVKSRLLRLFPMEKYL